MREPDQELHVLGWTWLIEAELVADVLDVGVRSEDASDQTRGIARQQPHHEKHHDGHSQERRDRG